MTVLERVVACPSCGQVFGRTTFLPREPGLTDSILAPIITKPEGLITVECRNGHKFKVENVYRDTKGFAFDIEGG